MTASDTRPSRTRRWLSCFAIVLGVLLLAVLLELCFRGVAFLRGQPYDPNNVQVAMRGLVGELDRLVPRDDRAPRKAALAREPVPHPYAGFDTLQKLQACADEAAYFRTDEARETYDILILGGSVAVQFAERGGERLKELLRADSRLAGRPIRLISEGRMDFKEPQQLMLFGYLTSLGYEPDAVIHVDGFAEVALAAENADLGLNPLYPSIEQWGTVAPWGALDARAVGDLVRFCDARDSARWLVDTTLHLALHESAILGNAALYFARGRHETALELHRRCVEAPPGSERDLAHNGPPFDRASSVASAVRAWTECTRSLAAMCATRSILYLHVLQPTLHDSGSKVLTEAEASDGAADRAWVGAVHEGYPLLRTQGRELAAAGVAFCDASMAFKDVDQKIYYDAAGFGVTGHRRLAEVIAEAFLHAMR